MSSEIIISSNETSIRSMMIKLMGRGLILSQRIEGQFVLKFDDIIDLINKISQRVNNQNHCKMSDFYAEFGYQDGSKEKIPSFETLQAFRSVNPTLCNSGRLQFAFLIDFNSKGVEKQSVDIIITGNSKNIHKKYNFFLEDEFTLGSIEINIEYTDVTWANDIKNLFEKYCETHVEKMAFRQRIAPFLSARILPLAMIPILLLNILAIEGSKSADYIKSKLGDYLNGISSNDKLAIINRKLDVLVFKENDIRSFWDILSTAAFMAFSIAVIVLCAMIVRNIPVSAIILSAESEKVFQRLEKRRSHSNIYATLGILLSIAVSIAASNIDRAILSYLAH